MPLKKLLNLPKQAQQRARQAWRLKGNTLVLRLPPGWPESQGIVRWWLHGDQGLMLRGQVTDLNELPTEVRAANTHAWTPATDTLLTQAELPTRSRSKIQQALPYALEDQLLGEPETLQFAYRALPDRRLAVAVTARERVIAWRAALHSAGLQLSSIAPVTLAVPLAYGNWSLAFAAENCLLRTGEYTGFACPASAAVPPTMLLTALNEVREKNQAPEALTVFYPPAGFDIDAWAQALGIPVSIDKADFWIERGAAVTPLNLLQGEFAPSGQTRDLTAALRPAAIMLGLWLAGSLVFTLWEWGQLRHTHDSVRQEMNQLFQRTLPGAKIVNPPLQMKRILEELHGSGGGGSADDLIALLAGIAPVMQAHPQTQLRSVRYDNTAVTVDLGMSDFQQLEGIKNALTSRGMTVEVLAANSGSGGVEGRLRVSAKTSGGIS